MEAFFIDESGGAPRYTGMELRAELIGALISHDSHGDIRTGLLDIPQVSVDDLHISMGPIRGVMRHSTLKRAAYLFGSNGWYGYDLAPRGSLPRIDLLIVKIEDHTMPETLNNSISWTVKTGTPAATPVKPTLGELEMEIAAFTVPATSGAVTMAQVTDTTSLDMRLRTVSALPTENVRDGEMVIFNGAVHLHQNSSWTLTTHSVFTLPSDSAFPETDWNNITYGGRWGGGNADASACSNTPISQGGMLTVYRRSAIVWQTYHTYATNITYTRTFTGASWTAWKTL